MIIQEIVSLVVVRLEDTRVLVLPVVYKSTRRTLWILSHKYTNFTPLYVIKHTWTATYPVESILGFTNDVGSLLQSYDVSQVVGLRTYNNLGTTYTDDVIKNRDGTYNLNNVNELMGVDATLILALGDKPIHTVLDMLRGAIATRVICNKPVPRQWAYLETHVMWYSITNNNRVIRDSLNRSKSTMSRQVTILKKLLGLYKGVPCKHLQPTAHKVDTRCTCSELESATDSCDFCKSYRIDDTLRDYYETQVEELYGSLCDAYYIQEED